MNEGLGLDEYNTYKWMDGGRMDGITMVLLIIVLQPQVIIECTVDIYDGYYQ